MGWQRILGSALVGFSLGTVGCETSQRTLTRDQFLQDPELLSAVHRDGGPAPEVTRAQKPETRPPTTLLDVAPDRTVDVSYGQRAATIRAVVNDQAILDEEVRANAYRDLFQAAMLPEPERTRRTTEVFNEALNRLIDRELVLQEMYDLFGPKGKAGKGGSKVLTKLQEAAREAFDNQLLKPLKAANHIKSDEDIKRIFAEQGLSLYSVRRQWERNFMELEYLRQRIFPLLDTRVNHQMIAEYYDSHPEEFKVSEGVEWQDLFVAAAKFPSRAEARAFAESLAEQARNGADFAKLVKEHDDGDSTLRGGAGVGGKRGEIRPPEAEDHLFTLTDGTVGPIIELPSGFHVIKLVHRQQAGLRPFDDKVQKQIRDKLRNDLSQVEVKRIVSSLRAKAVIEYARKAN
jgi:parvulin-like peptidyl-prolyl isomerase